MIDAIKKTIKNKKVSPHPTQTQMEHKIKPFERSPSMQKLAKENDASFQEAKIAQAKWIEEVKKLKEFSTMKGMYNQPFML